MSGGNLTVTGTHQYTYAADGSGRMLTALTKGGASATYQYDPFGRRTNKTVGGVTTRFMFDSTNVEIGEYDGTGHLLRRLLHHPDFAAPLAFADAAGNITYEAADRLGSVVATIAGSGATTNTYSYLPYGDTPSGTLSGTAFGYAGYRYDAETGTYHTATRSYDPRLGRFLQTDPIGQDGGLNIYAYAEGDPLNRSDPSGLEAEAYGGDSPSVREGNYSGNYSGNNSSHDYNGGSVGWTSQQEISDQAKSISHYPELGRFFSQGYTGDALAAAVASGEDRAAAGLGGMLSNGTGGTALVGGFFDYSTNGPILTTYLRAAEAGFSVSYFTWDQGSALGGFIDANRGQVNVIGHSYGGDTAASVVAAGHAVLNLTTIDPVGWFRPDFASVRANAGSWTDLNATGGSPFERTNLIAGIGGAYGTSPAGYATTFRNIAYTHGQIGYCAGGGC